MFNHVDIDLPKLSRETIDGVRYYNVPDEDELLKLVSITSITSHFNKQIFLDWRKRVGNEVADKITKGLRPPVELIFTPLQNIIYIMMRSYQRFLQFQIFCLRSPRGKLIT